MKIANLIQKVAYIIAAVLVIAIGVYEAVAIPSGTMTMRAAIFMLCIATLAAWFTLAGYHAPGFGRFLQSRMRKASFPQIQRV
ncbi:hypothetical protein [Burkholderia sp. Ac-20365]|uniref:hypothetical protein n=1 Tax=Burkholderia sp. Ac-20365 TaxID=2703897 RepID=UPI00197C6D44|nr:hypothetical protein [Burkholderia sp. Ac-20365]MBN3760964.1 hypothetical protein [Burkholderia sp. Ac-20365]